MYACTDGYIYVKKHNVFLRRTSYLKRDGYLQIKVSIGGKKKHLILHRIIAQAFIPNPENKPQVNHINGVKTDK